MRNIHCCLLFRDKEMRPFPGRNGGPQRAWSEKKENECRGGSKRGTGARCLLSTQHIQALPQVCELDSLAYEVDM